MSHKNNVELEGIVQRVNAETKDGKESVSLFLKCSVPVKRGDKSFDENFSIWVKSFGKLAQEVKLFKIMDTVRLTGSFKTIAKDVETVIRKSPGADFDIKMIKVYSTQINVKTIEKVTEPDQGLIENFKDDLPF